MKYRNVNQAEYLYNSTFNMGKGVEGHCQVVERGVHTRGEGHGGGTPNDGWDLNRARWEKAETGPDTAPAPPCNAMQ